jgi:hypothetical protein
LHWSTVLLLVTGVNLVAACIALARAKALAPRLSLPATRRHLSLGEDGARDEDAVERPLPV